MFVGYFISRDVNVDYRPALREQFPENVLVNFLIDVSSVDCSLLIAFVEGGDSCHLL